MGIISNLNNRKVTLMGFIPAVILIIFFLLKYVFNVITIEYIDILIQILAIVTAVFIPFIAKESEKNNEKNKLKEIYQECFDYLGKLSVICIERVDDKHKRILDRDKKIFALVINLSSYQKELLKLNIIFSKRSRNNTYWTNLLIENKLNISANVDDGNARVWYANIYLNGKHNEYPDKLKLKTEVYPILEKLSKKNKLKWNNDTLKYFNNLKDEIN